MSANPIEAILLAAGRSTRMGGVNKLLLPVDGVPMVRRSAALLCEVAFPVTVVVGHDADRVGNVLAGLDIRIVENGAPTADQQDSVAIGFAAADLAGRGVIVALADQPWLTGEDIAALIGFFGAQGGDHICVPRHEGRRGNPLVFPALVARLLRDDPTMSARRFIDTHPDRMAWFDVGHDRFHRDVDTPDDAATLRVGRIAPA